MLAREPLGVHVSPKVFRLLLLLQVMATAGEEEWRMAVRAPEYADFWLGRGAHGQRPAELWDIGERDLDAGSAGPPRPWAAPRRSWLAGTEPAAHAGLAWVVFGSALVGLAFQVLVLGAVACGVWHLGGVLATGLEALRIEQGAREAGRADRVGRTR